MRRLLPPDPVLLLARGQEGLVSTRQLVDHGVSPQSTATMVRRGELARIARGVYDATELLRRSGVSPRLLPSAQDAAAARRRVAWSGLLAFCPAAIAVGPSALALHQVDGLPRTDVAHCALPGGRHARSRPGLRLRSFDDGMQVSVHRGRLIAAPAWALAQAVCELDRSHGVAVLDSALNRRLVPDLTTVRALTAGRRGAARTRSWWDLVDARAQSPLETHARLQCHDAGVRPDDLQVPVRAADGRIVARGDLGWQLADGRWLLVEIDGRGPHSQPDALFADRRRQNMILSTGRVELLRITARDLAEGALVPAVRAALARHHRPLPLPPKPPPSPPRAARTQGSTR